MKIVAIIQARMGSTRLPGKVFMPLAGQPMLVRVINRVKRAKTIDKVIVATTTKPNDDQIVNLCSRQNWICERGSENDVLDRYYQAARKHQADVVIRISADAPLADPQIIDSVVQTFLEGKKWDYVSNNLFPKTFPLGLNLEVMSFEALEQAWQEDDNPGWREHVTPYIYRHPEKFRLHCVTNSEDYSSIRLTVDTKEDILLIRNIYDLFGDDQFSWQEVIKVVLKEHPEWLELNQHIVQKEVP